LAASEEREQAGSEDYQGHHFGKILQEGFSFSGFERDHLYLNLEGRKFVDVSGLTGLDSNTDGRGAAYADFDNDGDYDIFLTAFQGKAHHLFKNQVGQDAGSIRIALTGSASGRDAYGALVRVKTSQGVLTKMKPSGSGYISQSDPRLLFGLGSDTGAEWVEVIWPSGTHEKFAAIPAGTSVLIEEGTGEYVTLDEEPLALPEPPSETEAFLRLLRVTPGAEFADLPLRDLGGSETTFGAARGKGRNTLVNLWATYCVPCRKEMPELERLAPSFREAGLDVLGLSLDMGATQKSIPRQLRKLGVTYPIFTTDESVFPMLFSGEEIFIPLTFLVNEGGTVLEVFKGWSPETKERIESLIHAPGGAHASP
jgi:thiol-disulfide isomerase/thioredoxin